MLVRKFASIGSRSGCRQQTQHQIFAVIVNANQTQFKHENLHRTGRVREYVAERNHLPGIRESAVNQ